MARTYHLAPGRVLRAGMPPQDPGDPPPPGSNESYPVSTTALLYTPPTGIDQFGNGTVYDTEVISDEESRTVRFVSTDFGGDLQAALNGIARGEDLVLEDASTTIYKGSFSIPAKPGTGYIRVMSRSIYEGTFPRRRGRYGASQADWVMGDRVLPEDAPYCARICSTTSDPGLSITNDSNKSYWIFQGLDITPDLPSTFTIASGNLYHYNCVTINHSGSQIPHHLIFDRCLFRNPDSTWNIVRGALVNGRYIAFLDCGFHEMLVSGSQSQAFVGTSGTKFIKVINCHLEGGSENIMFGGGLPQSPNSGLYDPADVEIRRCHFTKQRKWWSDHPNWIGKSNFQLYYYYEFKNIRRILIEGCTHTGHWMVGSSGFPALFLVYNAQQGSTNPDENAAQDITIRWNHYHDTTANIWINSATHEHGTTNTRSNRIEVSNLVVSKAKITGRFIRLQSGGHDWTVRRVTVTSPNGNGIECNYESSNGPGDNYHIEGAIIPAGDYPLTGNPFNSNPNVMISQLGTNMLFEGVVYMTNTIRPELIPKSPHVFIYQPDLSQVLPDYTSAESDGQLIGAVPAEAYEDYGADTDAVMVLCGYASKIVPFNSAMVVTGQWGG